MEDDEEYYEFFDQELVYFDESFVGLLHSNTTPFSASDANANVEVEPEYVSSALACTNVKLSRHNVLVFDFEFVLLMLCSMLVRNISISISILHQNNITNTI